MAAGGPRDRPRGYPETARLRPRRESSCLVPRLRRVLRRDGQRQEPLCRGGPGGGTQPLLARKLSALDSGSHPEPVCGPVEWQREPLRVAFHPTGKETVSYDIVPGSAVLVEEAGDEAEPRLAAREAKPK